MPKPTETEIRDRFFYQRPTEKTAPKHEAVNQLLFETAVALVNLTPAGRNHALLLTHLEDARMRANSAIAQDTPEAER